MFFLTGFYFSITGVRLRFEIRNIKINVYPGLHITFPGSSQTLLFFFQLPSNCIHFWDGFWEATLPLWPMPF